MTAPTRRPDRGFTLVETVVTVGLMTLVAVALAAAFSVVARTSPLSTDNNDEARSVRGLTNWLPQDVASADPDHFAAGTATARSCSGVSGDPLLELSWNVGVSGFHTVEYRWVSVDSDSGTISRFACVDGNTATELVLTGPLDTITVGVAPVNITLLPAITPATGSRGVDLVVEQPGDGAPTEIVALEAYTTNVATPLPPTTTAPAAPPYTSPPNQPPTAEPVWVTLGPGSFFDVVLPGDDIDGPIPDYHSDTGALPAPTMTDLGLGTARIDATASPVGTYAFTYRVVDDDGAISAPAPITIIVGGGGPSTSVAPSTTSTTTPCSASMAVSPSSVARRADGRLDQDITVTLTSVNGDCLPLVVSFDPDPNDADDTPEQLAFGNAATIVIGRDDHLWNAPIGGTTSVAGHPFVLELRQGANGVPIGVSEDTEILTVVP